MNYDDFEEPGFFQRFGIPLAIVAALAAAGVSFAAQSFGDSKPRPRAAERVSMVRILPQTPPPPPPPAPPQEVQQQRMVAQTSYDEDELRPEPEVAPTAGNVLSTGIVGDGPPDAFGLSGARGGTGASRGPARPRSQWGWYAAQVQATISEALRKNEALAKADFRLEVRIWPDITGRVTRARLAGTTGDPVVDAALVDQVLTGLQLKEAPPPGMPSPILLRITARRSG